MEVPGEKGFDAERRQALLSSWSPQRYRERGFELPLYSYKQQADDLADRLPVSKMCFVLVA